MTKRLVTGLLVALVVSFLFTFWLSKKVGHAKAVVVPKQQYVAAAKNLDAGEVLSAANTRMVEWPADQQLMGAFNKPDAVFGRVMLYPLQSAQPITERQISVAGAGVGLSTKIPDGMRAIALKDDEVVGVAGFMLPGTHVDVLVTYHNGASPQPITSIVLQDVQILAAGQKTTPDPDGKATTADVVTLLVNPEDAEKAVLACAQGTVHFVLRNGVDHERVNGDPIQLAGAFDAPKPYDLAKGAATHRSNVITPTDKTYNVETVNGTKQTTERFQ